MDLAGLADHIGADHFRRACTASWRTAPGTGRSRELREDTPESDVPHELADLVEGDLDLALALYRAMPCYANLMYVGHWAERGALYGALRPLLDEPDDALADPVTYWLWSGPFEEDEAESTSAWEAVATGATARSLRRLLDVSGPVPWPAKGPVFTRLAADEAWHPALWRALRDATRDVFGRIDPAAARELTIRLTAAPPDVDADMLRRRMRSTRR